MIGIDIRYPLHEKYEEIVGNISEKINKVSILGKNYWPQRREANASIEVGISSFDRY